MCDDLLTSVEKLDEMIFLSWDTCASSYISKMNLEVISGSKCGNP